MEQYLVIYLTKVIIKDFKGKYDYIKNVSTLNVKKIQFFLSNQKHNKDHKAQ